MKKNFGWMKKTIGWMKNITTCGDGTDQKSSIIMNIDASASNG
jgi:hypothetical protein